MSMPWSKKRSKKSKRQASQQSEDTTTPDSDSIDSPIAQDTLPTVVVTDNSNGDKKSERNRLTAGVSLPPSQPSKQKHPNLRSSDPSDSGISSGSKPSISSLLSAPPQLRSRTSTVSSAESSFFATPPESIANDSSPNEPTPPQFPGIDEQYPPPTSNNPLLQSVKEQVEELSGLIKSMNSHLDTLTERIKDIETKITVHKVHTISTETQTIDFRHCPSLPDISEIPNMSCDQRVILWLVKKITEWKFLARWLRLDDSDITRIDTDHPNNDREQCYQMFLKWKAVDPDNYTYSVLGEALRKESRELYNDYVKEVQRIEKATFYYSQ